MSSAYCVSRIFSSCMLFLFLSNCYIALLSLNYLFYWPLLEWWIDWFKSMVRWVHNVLESWYLPSFPYISLCKSSIHMPCLDSLRCITQLDWLLKANCILISVYLFDCFIDSSDIVFMWPYLFRVYSSSPLKNHRQDMYTILAVSLFWGVTLLI